MTLWDRIRGVFGGSGDATRPESGRRLVWCQWPMRDSKHFVSPRVLTGLPAGPAEFNFCSRSGSAPYSSRGWTFQVWADATVGTNAALQ
jgi:hypothetical protein